MNNLKKYRKLKGLTQIELASKVGLPFQTFISRCELGQKRLPYSLAVKIANVLDCDVYDLMGDDIFKKGVEITKKPSKSIIYSQDEEYIKERLKSDSYHPVSFREASKLVKEKFGVKLLKEIYDFLLEIWRKEENDE